MPTCGTKNGLERFTVDQVCGSDLLEIAQRAVPHSWPARLRDDAIQAACLRMLESDDALTLAGWRKLAGWAALDEARGQQRRECGLCYDHDDTRSGPGDNDAIDTLDAVAQIVDRGGAQIVALTSWGYTPDEVAGLLRVSRSTVYRELRGT